MRRTLLPLAVFLMLVLGTGTAQAATVTIETLDNNNFDPATATVQVGDTIEFENTGVLPHNAVSDDGKINIPMIAAGETKSVVVEEPGEIPYVCQFHIALGMEGTIIVEGAAGAPAAAADEPEEGATNAPEDQQEAEGDEEASDPEGGDEGGETDAGVADPTAIEAPEEPPVGPAFMILSALIALLVILGMVPAAKTYLMPALKSAGDAPTPVGPPPTIKAVAAAGPAAAVATAPAPPAAPAAAPAAAAAPVASPTPAAPPKAAASPVAPTEPPLDPEKVYQAVLKDEQTKGTDTRVAEARAKAARMRAEEALATPAAPAATAPAPAAPPAAAEVAAAPAAEAPAPAAPAAAPAAEAPSAGVSAEEAAAIRKKVYEEELAKGTDARVAEARSKAAEMRAKKGTKLPSK